MGPTGDGLREAVKELAGDLLSAEINWSECWANCWGLLVQGEVPVQGVSRSSSVINRSNSLPTEPTTRRALDGEIDRAVRAWNEADLQFVACLSVCFLPRGVTIQC